MAVWPTDEIGPRYWVVPTETAHLRASDADRDHAVDLLRTGFIEGRLTNEEYDERVAQAYASRTYSDLTRLIADLPAPAHLARSPVRRRRPTNALAVVALICGLIQPFTVGLTMFPAIFLGHAARRQIRRSGESGGGLALAGLLLGWVGVTIAVLSALGVLVAVAAAHAHVGQFPRSSPAIARLLPLRGGGG